MECLVDPFFIQKLGIWSKGPCNNVSQYTHKLMLSNALVDLRKHSSGNRCHGDQQPKHLAVRLDAVIAIAIEMVVCANQVRLSQGNGKACASVA